MNISDINARLEGFLQGRLDFNPKGSESDSTRMRYLFALAMGLASNPETTELLPEFTQISNSVLSVIKSDRPVLEQELVTKAVESIKNAQIERLRSASDEAISRFLGLDTWKTDGTDGEKEEAVRRIIQCFRDEAVRRIIQCFRDKGTSLNLSLLGLSSVPQKAFEYLQGLKALNLSENELLSITLSNLRDLTYLKLNDNNLTSADLSNLPLLKKLNLSVNRLESVNIAELTSLEILNLSANEVTDVDFSSLTSLTSVNIEKNRIKTVSGLPNLHRLKNLDASNNELTVLDVSKLTELVKLDVSENMIRELDLSSSKKLISLNVSSNLLFSLPSISDLVLLEELNVSGNCITSLDISLLSGLKELNASINSMQELRLPTASSLTDLKVSYNELHSIDVSNQHLLRSLDVSNNYLSALSVSGLENLASLDASDNNLSALSVSGVGNLVSIELSRNPFIDPLPLQTLQNFCACLEALRACSPNSPFRQTLRPFPLMEEDPAFFRAVCDWLVNLTETEDFAEGSRQVAEFFASKVLSLLDLAFGELEFREIMRPILFEANQSCEDRAIFYLNQLELVKTLYQARFHSIEELIPVFRGSFASEELTKYAIKVIKSYGEELEAFLDLQIRLKEEFDLPVVSQQMNHPQCSSVTPEIELGARTHLKKALDDTKAFAEYLVANELWQTKVQERFPQKFEEIRAPFYEELELLMSDPSYTDPPGADTENMKENIQKALTEPLFSEMKRKTRLEMLRITREILGIHEPPVEEDPPQNKRTRLN